MTTMFIFGAGASAYSGPCAPEPPPLGRDLFGKLRLKGIATTFDDAIAQTFEKDGFEAGMDAFWDARPLEVPALLRDMAAFFAPFEPLEGNTYIALLRLITAARERVVIATTNYDLLIERAAIHVGLKPMYGVRPAFRGELPIYKIHGSSNFLPDTRIKLTKSTMMTTKDGENVMLETPVYPVFSTEEIQDFCDTQDSMAPAVAAYNSKKRLLFCREAILFQQRRFHEAIRNADSIYVVGLAVTLHDTHIWGELESARANITYIGPDQDDFAKWSISAGRGVPAPSAKGFSEGLEQIEADLKAKWGGKFPPGR